MTPHPQSIQVKRFQPFKCNVGAVPWDGPEAAYHRCAEVSLCKSPPRPTLPVLLYNGENRTVPY